MGARLAPVPSPLHRDDDDYDDDDDVCDDDYYRDYVHGNVGDYHEDELQPFLEIFISELKHVVGI